MNSVNNKPNYEDIKKIIESSHLNFLIGSGASRPYFETLGEVENLLSALAKENESANKKSVEASIKNHYFNVAIRGNLHIQNEDDPCPHCNGQLKQTNAAYHEFIRSLYTILNKRKSNLVSKQINLFTTNMDLFLDFSIDKSGYVLNDGFSGRSNPIFGTENFHNSVHKLSSHYEYKSEHPLFNLFKLHGSINWKKSTLSSGEFDIHYDYGLSTLSGINNVKIPKEECIEIEYEETNGNEEVKKKKTRTIQYLLENACNDTQNHESFLNAYSELVMINPETSKFQETTKSLIFYELLRMYANHLERENSVLFVVGFSFADQHIREITKRVVKSNPTLLVVIFCRQSEEERFAELFDSAQNVVCLTCDDGYFELNKVNERYLSKLGNELQWRQNTKKELTATNEAENEPNKQKEDEPAKQ